VLDRWAAPSTTAEQSLSGLLRDARLKVAQACVEDVNYKTSRGLDKSKIAALADGAWIQRAQNLLVTGPTELVT
jgi:hypothetical protein